MQRRPRRRDAQPRRGKDRIHRPRGRRKNALRVFARKLCFNDGICEEPRRADALARRGIQGR